MGFLRTTGLGLLAVIALPLLSQTALASEINHCRNVPNRTDALDFPSKHAWNLFLTVVHPAKDMKTVRGLPDCSKALGAPGTTSVWETWRLARTEVFLEDGSAPPEWNDLSLPRGYLGTIPDSQPSPHSNFKKQPEDKVFNTPKPAFDPEEDQGVFVDHGGIGETHMNRSAYEFIRDNCLFNRQGLRKYAADHTAGKKPPINFPVDAIEVKAVWVEFTASDVASNKHRKYYIATLDGKTYGLVSFHILTKDTPNWFWATFHHVDNPPGEFEIPDTHGRPKSVNGTIWENYVLGGTQVDFITPTGAATILADHYIEFGFERSSCMTCHANANGSPDQTRGPVQTLNVGPPDASKFLKDGKPFYVQTDFVWSIPFRARDSAVALPAYCN